MPRASHGLLWSVPVVTLASLLVVELGAHGPFGLSTELAATILLLSVGAALYGAFVAGVRGGLLSSAMLALYMFHYSADHATVVDLSPRTVQSALLVLLIAGGLSGLVGALKQRADDATARAMSEERRHAEALRRANTELTRANETLEAFSYVVSHDLKEPVRATATYLEMAKDSAIDPATRANIDRAGDANERLRALLLGLLEYSRASLADLRLEPVALEDVLESEACRAQFAPTVRERGAELTVEGEPIVVRATAPLLCQVLGNLVLNAVKHNRAAAPKVRIRGERAGPREVLVHIDDNGPGFMPETLDRFRAGGKTFATGGGFGLVLARRGVERLGGEMHLGSSPEGGARVTLRLPAADAPAARPGP